MSDDLIERLELWATDRNGLPDGKMAQQAAAEIEAARKRIAELEESLADMNTECDIHAACTRAQKERAERAEAELAAVRVDAERWRYVVSDPRYQGTRNGYKTFTQAVDAAREQQ